MSRRPDQLNHPPIRLRSALQEAGVSMAVLTRELADIRHQTLGQSISKTSLHYVARHGLWPAGYDRDQLQQRIEAVVAAAGGSTDALFEPDDSAARSRQRNKAEKPFASIVPPTFENPIPEPEMLSEAARRQFGLLRHPFVNEIDGPQDLFYSRDARYVREAMYYAAKHSGFLAVVGESGAGKSVLRRDLIERLRRAEENVTVVQPKTTDKKLLTAHHICHAILADISVERPKISLEALARQVERALLDSSAAGRTHVLVIEEAHDLNVNTLKFLKRFWEIEDGYKKLIGIILIGQTELGHVLDERRNPQAREVIRRCEIATLRPLGDDVRTYVEHKLKRVMDKARGIDTVFDGPALDALRQRLLLVRQGSKAPEDYSYPLQVHTIVVAAMNAAVDLGYERVTAELVREV